jgi:hypothetical protein
MPVTSNKHTLFDIALTVAGSVDAAIPLFLANANVLSNGGDFGSDFGSDFSTGIAADRVLDLAEAIAPNLALVVPENLKDNRVLRGLNNRIIATQQ